MKRIQTGLKGITTGSTCEDGDMYSLVNLRRKGGVLHPAFSHVADGTVCGDYDIYFVHRNEDWEHWIGVKNTDGAADVFWNVDSEAAELKKGVEGIVNSVEQNGNLLVFITDDTQYYALFRNGGYTWYGELPDLVPLEWNCYENVTKTFGYTDFTGESDSVDVPVSSLFEYTKGLVNQGYARITADYLGENGWYNEGTGGFGGLFTDAFFVRYAYRLYDHTNVKLSPPILILPSNLLLNLLSVWIEPSDSRAAPWSFPFTPSMNTERYDDKSFNLSSTARVGMFVPGVKYDLSSLAKYEGLIKGVDIFMSPYVGVSNVDNTNTVISFVRSSDESIISKRSSLVGGLTGDMMRRIREMSSFYLVKSLDIGESTGGNYIPFPEKTDVDTIYNIGGLVNREQLADDDFSIHRIGARKSYAYNGRLHLADTAMTYFAGFDRSFFGWNAPVARPSGEPIYYNGEPEPTGNDFKWNAGDELIIETEITRGSYSGRVYAKYMFGKASVCMNSAMWSYPDALAKRMTLYRKDGGNGKLYRVRTLELTEHEFLNVAFYLEDSLRPVCIRSEGELVASIDEGRPFTVRSQNELMVSDMNNPLQFKIKNTTVVGTGRIMAIGSNVMSVSGRNYGAFPLYVFTTEGVYTLRVGEGDTAYSAVTQPAYLEPPITDVICQMPGGVVFAIARGLCLANGGKIDFLTGNIEERPAKLNFEIPAAMADAGLYRNCGHEAFMDYLKGLTGMFYDNYRNELVVMNGASSYNWVMALDDMSFYVSTERIDHIVRNSYPGLKVIAQEWDDALDQHVSRIIDFSREEDSAEVSFVTRPLLYGTGDVKMMERIIVRAEIDGLKKVAANDGYPSPYIITYRSDDGRNFLVSRGLRLRECSLKDIDTGMYGRTGFRQYALAFAGRCGRGTKIEFVESEVVKGYDNTKMR
jgi:hypothetical protein